MQETRHYEIIQKVFTKDDILKIGQILLLESKQARDAGDRANVSFELRCSDKTSYESESLELFREGGVANIKVPISIKMSFSNYEKENYIGLELTHGSFISAYNPLYNNLTVRGNDSTWVNGNFTKVKEAIDSVRPQNIWIVRHQTLFLYVIALCLGVMLYFTTDLATKLFIGQSMEHIPLENRQNWLEENLPNWALYLVVFVNKAPWITYVIMWLLAWMFGLCVGGPIRSWFLQLWPEIELDLGPEHLKIEKVRRMRLKIAFVAVVLPIIASLSYDMLKRIL